MDFNYLDLINMNQESFYNDEVGITRKRNVDKTAVFYHVVTTTKGKEKLYYSNVASYRHNLLCELCKERNIKVLFSTTMLNHTHEVFLTPSWKALSEVIRIVNLNVRRFIVSKYEDKFRKGRRIFAGDIAYIPIRDIRQLFYVGMYIYSNPEYLNKDGKGAPHSSFWMMESGHYVAPYDGRLYQALFGMSGEDLFKLYSSMTREQARDYAKTHFKNWTGEDTRAIFYRIDTTDQQIHDV